MYLKRAATRSKNRKAIISDVTMVMGILIHHLPGYFPWSALQNAQARNAMYH